MFDPTTPKLRRVKAAISPESWLERVAKARLAEEVLRKIVDDVAGGLALNAALAKHLPANRRSWALRWLPRYQSLGVEGLIDTRVPREPTVSRACRRIVEAARSADPRVTVEQIWALLREAHLPPPLPSESTIKREFARVDEQRRAQSPPPDVVEEVVDLPFAGGELLAAAEQETGGIAALTEEVGQLADWAQSASVGRTPAKDTERRDERGQFTADYNRARTRQPGEQIASYLRTAEEKAEGRVPSWPRFVREQPHTRHAKLAMLTFGWMVSQTKGWASLRAPEVAGLAPLAGFAYMPSTLEKFVSALAISGAGAPLLDAVGRRWHEVAQSRWGEAGAMAAVYLDNQAKEVWSSLFTKSGRVAHRSKVMPCITTTYAHTGAGTPMVLGVQSGSAPLAPRVLSLVEEAEALCGDEVERVTIIDAEGSTFDVLAAFRKAKRVIVTPLRPARAPELELTYSRGSYYRPYREDGELRIAHCTLTHRSTNRTLELGALLVRRAHREHETVLLTTGLELGMEGRALADLYFARWPVQENAFKEGGVLGLIEHRGNCGRMVANIAVVTTLERLEERVRQEAGTLEVLDREAEPVAREEAARAKEDRRAQAALATRRRRLDALIAAGKTAGRGFARAAVDHQQALVRAEATARAATVAAAAAEKNRGRREALAASLATAREEASRLEPQRAIRELDVAQDMILTATKLTAAQLISFALREYLPSVGMTADTFVSRVFPMQGRKELTTTEERIYFYENARDPEVTEALRAACRRLNERSLQRDGRTLRYRMVAPPRGERVVRMI